ncbi:MAG: TVP38/TMEM64 family protein [Chloroflexota bacterium]
MPTITKNDAESAIAQDSVDGSTTKSTTEGSFISRNWQKLVAVGIWVALIGGLFAYINLNNLTITDALRNVVSLMQTPIGPLIYLLVYAIRPLAFFSAVVLTLAAGSIYGPILGVVYTVIASNTSATVAYFLGRFLGKGLIDETQSTGIVQRYAERMRNNSFETILIMRFIYLPYDLVNYLGGILRIDYKSFILATILGSIPGTITFVLAGASLQIDDVFNEGFRPEFNPWTLAASVGLFVLSLFLSRYFKTREAKRTQEEPGN